MPFKKANISKCSSLSPERFGFTISLPKLNSLSTAALDGRVVSRGGVEDTRLEAKAKAKDTKKIRGQGQGQPFRGQTLSKPRTGMLKAKDTSASALQKKKKGLHKNFLGDLKKKEKKRSSQKFFKRFPQKNVFQKIFQALHKILTIQKIVLSSSREQANFRGLEASRPRPRTSKCVLEDSTSALNIGYWNDLQYGTTKPTSISAHIAYRNSNL